jgi:HlyD family secretion protein
MRLDHVEPELPLAPAADTPSGNAWRWQRPGRRGGSWLLKLVVLLALAAAAVWAYRANVASGRPGMDMNMRVSAGDTPFPVTLVQVERRAMTGTVVYTGSVAPFNEEDIFPRVTGRIVEMPVYPGDAVRAGQIVARLDDIELSSRVREAEATAASAQANRAQMEADVVAAQHAVVQSDKERAMVEAELAYARSVAKRSEQLVGVGAISRQEYENDRALALSQEAKREAAQAKVEQSRAMEASARKKLEAADAMVAQGRAALRTATVVRDYVTIVAPSSGYVVKRLVAPGVLVQPGMPIFKIAQIDRVRLQANVGEKDVASIRVGSAVTVTTVGTNQPVIGARVTAVFPFVDQGARTAVVEALVENPGRRFLPGQYVTMQFSTGERSDAAVVPRSAVARLGGKATVWVVRDGRAESRTVGTGLEDPDRVEITQGLAVGDVVVARGGEGLYSGARIVDTAAAAPSRESGGHAGPTSGREPAAPAETSTPAPSERPAAGTMKGMDHGGR